MLFYVRIAEDDLKNIETCRSIRGLYVKLYILMLVHLLAYSISVHQCTDVNSITFYELRPSTTRSW